jgi:hypothetical protein
MVDCRGPCEEPADIVIQFSQGDVRTYCQHHFENLQASEFLEFEVKRKL